MLVSRNGDRGAEYGVQLNVEGTIRCSNRAPGVLRVHGTLLSAPLSSKPTLRYFLLLIQQRSRVTGVG